LGSIRGRTALYQGGRKMQEIPAISAFLDGRLCPSGYRY
jgi:hypothetical protein